MVLMEKIIRPHAPVDTAPASTTSRCRSQPNNTVVKFNAPPGLDQYGKLLQQQVPPQPLPPPPDTTKPPDDQPEPEEKAKGGGGGEKQKPKDPPKVPDPQDKHINSSWSYAYKKYMTKKEKEISDPSEEKDGIVQDETGANPPLDTSGGLGGDDSSSGSPPPSVGQGGGLAA